MQRFAGSDIDGNEVTFSAMGLDLGQAFVGLFLDAAAENDGCAGAGEAYCHGSAKFTGSTDHDCGFAGEIEGFSYDIGYFAYMYSDDWDDTYTEVAATIGYGPISVSHAVGEWDGFGTPVDYTFTSVTAEYKGAYITFGSFGDETDGDYTEIGYGMTVSDVDYGIALINNDEDLDGRSTASDGSVGETALTFSIGYAWDL